MFNDDRIFLENKYHKTDEDFNPYARMAYHGYEYDKNTGLEDEEIKEGLLKMLPELSSLPSPVAKAKAFSYVLENTKIDVSENDYFIGLWSVNRLIDGVTQSLKCSEICENIIPDVWEKMCDLNNSSAVSIWVDFDHVVPDWNSVLNLGFTGLLKRVENYFEKHKKNGDLTSEKTAFFEGIITEYKAIISLIDRLYRYSLTKNGEKSKVVSDCLKSIKDDAPKNIYEAMQVVYIYFMLSECFDCYQVRSLGNGLDGSLYSFYKRDIENKTFAKEEIKELMKYFLFQWEAIGNYWGQPFYMGGTREDGSTKYNDLSLLILEAYDELEIYNPKIQLKVNGNTPNEILFKVFDMIRRGKSSFVFCCEPGMIKAVINYGATYKEALNMDIRGCYETGVRANEISTGTGYINDVKAVLYVLSNGYDGEIGKQIGVKTGELTDFKTFEDFYFAVLKQWKNLIEMTVSAANEYEKYFG